MCSWLSIIALKHLEYPNVKKKEGLFWLLVLEVQGVRNSCGAGPLAGRVLKQC